MPCEAVPMTLMDVNCEGCAGCCIDWRALAPDGLGSDHERQGPFEPLDDVYNLVALRQEEVREFVNAGLGDALAPRLFRAAGDRPSTEIDGVSLAAIEGKPAFYVGIRKAPKAVAPFDGDPTWLPACAFLDPVTLKCRLHGSARYPDECASYPGRNLTMGTGTECERVERAFGGERLLDDEPPDDPPMLGQGAVGGKVFVHPDPAALRGVVGRFEAGRATASDRARFVGAAAGAVPGSTEVDEERAADYRTRAETADSWAGRALEEWERKAGTPGEPAGDAVDSGGIERGAPPTSPW